jgi:hypothetical protein
MVILRKEPIKIIYKYKNNNRRSQYHIYIYIGDVSPSIMEILTKIENKNLYNSWISLNNKEILQLNNMYGKHWYKLFFNTYHINYIINMALEVSSNKKALISKFGAEWFKEHIQSHKLIDKKLFYSYDSKIRSEEERKARKKGREFQEDDEDTNFLIKNKENINNLFAKFNKQSREISSDLSPDLYGGGNKYKCHHTHYDQIDMIGGEDDIDEID